MMAVIGIGKSEKEDWNKDKIGFCFDFFSPIIPTFQYSIYHIGIESIYTYQKRRSLWQHL